MARSAEGSKDSGACMAHSKPFTAVSWILESRGLQGLVTSLACCCRQLDQPSSFVI